MISRRQWIGCSVAASALVVTGRFADAIESSPRSASPIALVVVDDRFDAARRLALAVAARDVPRVALPRDALDLWHRQLESLCRSGAHAIAGVTTERGFFLLHTLAADHRLRVLSRSDHGPLLSWRLGPRK